jgi:hypothetical protein
MDFRRKQPRVHSKSSNVSNYPYLLVRATAGILGLFLRLACILTEEIGFDPAPAQPLYSKPVSDLRRIDPARRAVSSAG